MLVTSLPYLGHADTFQYTFNYSHAASYDYGYKHGTDVIDFTYTSPVLITTDTVATADTSFYYSVYYGAAFTDPLKITFQPLINHGIGGFSLDGVHLAFGIAFGSPYPYQSAFTVGDHPCGTDCDWNIVDIPSATTPSDPSNSPVPEPSTFALLGTGLIGAAGALRRRLL